MFPLSPPLAHPAQVESVHEIAEATGGEVTLAHLGPRFNAEVQAQG